MFEASNSQTAGSSTADGKRKAAAPPADDGSDHTFDGAMSVEELEARKKARMDGDDEAWKHF